MNKNDQIAEYLKTKQRAEKELEDSISGLYEMGVRFVSLAEDGTPEISALQDLLPRYEYTLEDFEWKAIYDDGTEIDQNGDIERHFGDIDQSKLAKLVYISNFIIDTSNQEKRLVITLNFKDGTFDFLNCGAMDIRGKLVYPIFGDKKLILFKRKRETFTANVNIEKKEFSPTGDKILYNRYYLGYETGDRKLIICICPNGEIEIENI
jgi:hypothetical protein